MSWTARLAPSLQCAIETALIFCSRLQLPIDWTKSFAWATTKHLQKCLRSEAPELLPPGATLKVVTGARDLGVQFRFQARGQAGSVSKRLEEGRRRLQALQQVCRPLFTKARLVQTSVWPAALYGMEGSLVPEAAVQKLRSSAARPRCWRFPRLRVRPDVGQDRLHRTVAALASGEKRAVGHCSCGLAPKVWMVS